MKLTNWLPLLLLPAVVLGNDVTSQEEKIADFYRNNDSARHTNNWGKLYIMRAEKE